MSVHHPTCHTMTMVFFDRMHYALNKSYTVHDCFSNESSAHVEQGE